MNRATRKTRFAKTSKHNARVKLAARRHAGKLAFLRNKAEGKTTDTELVDALSLPTMADEIMRGIAADK